MWLRSPSIYMDSQTWIALLKPLKWYIFYSLWIYFQIISMGSCVLLYFFRRSSTAAIPFSCFCVVSIIEFKFIFYFHPTISSMEVLHRLKSQINWTRSLHTLLPNKRHYTFPKIIEIPISDQKTNILISLRIIYWGHFEGNEPIDRNACYVHSMYIPLENRNRIVFCKSFLYAWLSLNFSLSL